MKPTSWNYRTRTEKQYSNQLHSAMAMLGSPLSQATTIPDIVAIIENMSNQSWFKEFAYQQSAKMVKSVLVNNALDWRDAARKGTHAQKIYRALAKEVANGLPGFQDLIEQNATYIKTMPLGISKQITALAARENIAGRRGASIVEAIRSAVPEMTKSHAKLIARTEISKTNAAVQQLRAEEIGLYWYRWFSVEDARVRHSHREMSRHHVYCKYGNDPCPEMLFPNPKVKHEAHEYYSPGNIYNCRCIASPVFDIGDISFPMTLYWGGQLRKMNRVEFLSIAA